MIWNIIDRRSRPYRWKRINAIGEDVEHDNACDDSDQAPVGDPDSAILYAQREAVSVEDAVGWASEMKAAVTLYLYDEGEGTTSVSDGEIPHTGHFGSALN